MNLGLEAKLLCIILVPLQTGSTGATEQLGGKARFWEHVTW